MKLFMKIIAFAFASWERTRFKFTFRSSLKYE